MTTKLLANQYKNILADPVEGFTVELEDEASLFEWKVYIEGPKDTCYEGGVFQLQLSFPKDYPMSPPVLKFMSDFWHPNVYHDGKVCMSILHPPGEDAMSGELAEERWLPTQSVTTIVLSLMSLLNDPNCSSPANVDASVEWRKQRESYINKCKKLVEKANKEKPAHIQIPHPDTNEEEHKKIVQKWKEMNTGMDAEDFYEPNEEDEEESDDENENEFLESNSESESFEEAEEKAKESERKPNGADKEGKMGNSAEISKPAPEPILVVEPSKKPEQVVSTPVPATYNPPVEKQPPIVEAGPSVPPATIPATNITKEEIVVDNNVNNQEAGSSSGKGKKQKTKSAKKGKKCTIM